MSVIYYNGTILTMNDRCPQVQAVLTENGRIRKAGTREEVFAHKAADTVCVDLQGKTMLPAFLDGHSHFAGLANSLAQCDLSQAEDFDDMVRLLQAFIKEQEIPEGEWVSGTNYDHNFLREKKHPDKYVLDAVSRTHPVVVIHASSHMGVANSEGLRRQALGADTSDPEGGHYGRTSDGSELDGYMEENAFVQFRNRMPMMDADRFMELFRRAQEIYASNGIATVQEGMVTEPLFGLLQYAQKNRVFYLDLVGYPDLEHCERLFEQNERMCHHYVDHFRIGGGKIFLDGSPQGRTAWVLEPYADAQDGYCGYPVKTDAQLYRLIETALEKRLQLLAHCNGDAAAEQYLTQFEKAVRAHPSCDTQRPVMIHAQLVRREQLKRMLPLSMMPSFFAAHTYYWGDIHIKNFGMERAAAISPAGSAQRLHLPYTFHQDSPVLRPNVFETIWCAAARVTKTGVPLAQDERISVADALKAVTVHAAYQYGEEKEKGSIEEGKLADLIVVDQNPLEIPVDEVRKIRVLETIKEGKTVYRKDARCV